MQTTLTAPDIGILKSPSKPPPVSPLRDARTLFLYLSLLSLLVLLLVPLISLLLQKTRTFLHRRLQIAPTHPTFVADDEPTSLLSNADEPVLLVAPTPPSPRILQAHGGGFLSDLDAHVAELGGWTILLFNVIRFLGCLALLALTIAAVVVDSEKSADPYGGVEQSLMEVLKKWKKGEKKKKEEGRERRREAFGREEWVEVGQVVAFLYCTVLALLTLTIRKARFINRQVKPHLALLLLFGFSLAAYRNLWPLATFHGQPRDIALHRGKKGDGWTSLVWWRVGLLGLIGVAVPLLVPRPYSPVDSKNPSTSPSPEQTAPLLSRAFFSHLTPLIIQAWRVPSLHFDALPPVADYDDACYLSETSMAELDPMRMEPATDNKSRKKRQRHIFFGIVRIYWRSGLMLISLILSRLVADFARPLAINRLLSYIEKPESSEVRPFMWIVGLSLGPLVTSLSYQYYISISTRLLVRTQGLLSTLILNHSMRIRFVGKPEVATTRPSSRLPSGISTPALVETEEDGSSVVGDRKGKSKASDEELPAAELVIDGAEEKQAQAGSLLGKINNLIGSDLEAVVEGRDFLIPLVFCPLQLILAIVFLNQIVSWSAFIGLAAILVTFPLPLLVLRAMNQVQEDLAVATDARVQAVTEAMSSLRMLKMFAWQKKVEERIAVARKEELRLIRKKSLISVLNNNANFALPLISLTITFASYSLLQKKTLTSSIIFSTLSTFELLHWTLHALFEDAALSIQGKVSLDRVNDFLHNTEVLDSYDENEPIRPQLDPSFLGFKQASFAWLREEEDEPNANVRNFRIHLDVEFLPGINIIHGPTGSGKSSVLAALLGEMHFEPFSIESNYNLPRSKGVAFVPQEPWLLNATIRDNIILDLDFDPKRFETVLSACSLKRDLELLPGGDQTEVGEKGITLSGGQKARISLARAVYSQAQILLLDDVLSALDSHTSRWIVENCLDSDLLKGRTVLLATHHLVLVTPIASFILRLGRDGTVESQGPIEKVIKEDLKFERVLAAEKKEDARITENVNGTEEKPVVKADALVLEEEKGQGKVGWATYSPFIDALGWKSLLFYVAAILVAETFTTAATWWLGRWGNQYLKHAPEDVNVPFYLGIYALIVVVSVTVYSSGLTNYYLGSVRASRSLHNTLVASVLNSTFRWLDSTPVGRILARFSKDFRAVDGLFPVFFADFVDISSILIIKFISIVYMVPAFVIPAVAVGVVGVFLGEVYIHAQLSVRREMSNAKSPLFNHLNSAINGAISIRAYGIQDWVESNTREKVNKYTRTAVCFYNLNRWVTVAIDTLANLFTAALAAYLVYVPRGTDSGEIGWLLNIVVAFSSHIIWWVRSGNMVGVEANSIERILDFFPSRIPQEPAFSNEYRPPASWPTSGIIKVENLVARYSEDSSAPVLNGLSFSITSGEKIGVVGRTGAGKSSLALALLRMIPTKGKVLIDGLDSRHVNLSSLRTSITIIPQDPILLSGSLRYNLDPFEENDDPVLNDALHASGLSSLQAGADENSAMTITLDTIVSSGGANLSQGQRQVLVLARALVRRSPIVIMDEATSSVDFETDEAIQRGIRKELSGVTVLTIAHRLRSIADYDRVMCLSEGKIIAFDTPKKLLSDPKSYFSMLVKSSGEEDVIREMAGM